MPTGRCRTPKIHGYDKMVLAKFIHDSGLSHTRRLDDRGIVCINSLILRIERRLDVCPQGVSGVPNEFALPGVLGG
jgi:hypothetical protein